MVKTFNAAAKNTVFLKNIFAFIEKMGLFKPFKISYDLYQNTLPLFPKGYPLIFPKQKKIFNGNYLFKKTPKIFGIALKIEDFCYDLIFLENQNLDKHIFWEQ